MRNQNRQRGQGLVEYALILILVAVIVIVILSQMGHSVGERFADIQCSLQFQRPAYAEWSDERQQGICYEDVVQPDGTKVKTEIGVLNV